ncbi:MAG: translation initiation factor IF-6 [Candidatus ainarchaeum sp.]|jgi:translation initiation factor 6|nr:translation initiation factor IF-6 [Candidatus ainarchaeum sp.]MDD3085838.1 translation initiation factor IF-6 [Candidatus ainarchaeum sp.]MDD4128579.1 translation initiation factor IF-6 [Candidatus ainarchaeum sp.]MDD4468083.1 translation initiation factor IF-6 [Candidatus ainarchaeum sp.]HPM85645.1 translation initiation factor IF-6 [archaeon]
MNIERMRIMGSIYTGLFAITNDNLCFLPPSISEKEENMISEILQVKTVKTNIYSSPLLAVFAKMNNKYAYIPSFASQKEIETIEKEIKVKILKTQQAIGNLIELNDNTAIVSKILDEKIVEELKNTGLEILITNIGKSEVTGSSIVTTNKGFLVNPYANKEEIKEISEILKIKGGSSTANSGDYLIRNSVLANSKGMILGEQTTPFEINKIEEALE